MDEKKLKALREKYGQAGGDVVFDPKFKAVVDKLFKDDGSRSLPYGGLPTFMDLKHVEDFAGLDVAVIGVPMDLGVTNRPGARFGPRAIRGIERIGPYNHALEIIPELEMAGTEMLGYINRKTGELITLRDGDFSSTFDFEEEEAELAKAVEDDDNFIQLPDQFDIHEYAIMERFCYSLEDERIQNALLRAISGRGAFRSFKDRIAEEGVRDDWFAFRDGALKKIAADFLEFENIPFVDE